MGGQRPAASTTLKVSESRGNPNSFTLVTPSVKDAARKHFGCNTAEGVELENQPTGGGCWGSHWDERILHDDLMAPIGGESAVLSSITLAAFSDMGFYNVNIDLSSRLEFGNNLGCTFITDPCISKDGVALFKKKGYFCNEESETSCTPDRKYKAKCNVVEYNMAITPTWFQHFGTDSKKGGSLQEMDFCPYFAAYSNQNCQDATHVSQQNAYGEIYGTESRCFDSTLTQEEYIGSSTITQMCYRHKCLNDALEITAISKNKNLVTITCTRADVGKIKTVDGFKGTLICPPVDDVCSTPATTQQNTDLLLCLNSSSSSTTTTTGT